MNITMIDTLTLAPDYPYASRTRRGALFTYRSNGMAIWLRPSGRAVLYFRDMTGRRRQRTWRHWQYVGDRRQCHCCREWYVIRSTDPEESIYCSRHCFEVVNPTN